MRLLRGVTCCLPKDSCFRRARGHIRWLSMSSCGAKVSHYEQSVFRTPCINIALLKVNLHATRRCSSNGDCRTNGIGPTLGQPSCGITLRRVQRRSVDTLCDGRSSNLGCWKLEEARDVALRTSKWHVAPCPIVPIMDTRVVPTIFLCGLGGVA